jgi:hypothetical protein
MTTSVLLHQDGVSFMAPTTGMAFFNLWTTICELRSSDTASLRKSLMIPSTPILALGSVEATGNQSI